MIDELKSIVLVVVGVVFVLVLAVGFHSCVLHGPPDPDSVRGQEIMRDLRCHYQGDRGGCE